MQFAAEPSKRSALTRCRSLSLKGMRCAAALALTLHEHIPYCAHLLELDAPLHTGHAGRDWSQLPACSHRGLVRQVRCHCCTAWRGFDVPQVEMFCKLSMCCSMHSCISGLNQAPRSFDTCRGLDTCPQTKAHLTSSRLAPNNDLKRRVLAWLKAKRAELQSHARFSQPEAQLPDGTVNLLFVCRSSWIST